MPDLGLAGVNNYLKFIELLRTNPNEAFNRAVYRQEPQDILLPKKGSAEAVCRDRFIDGITNQGVRDYLRQLGKDVYTSAGDDNILDRSELQKAMERPEIRERYRQPGVFRLLAEGFAILGYYSAQPDFSNDEIGRLWGTLNLFARQSNKTVYGLDLTGFPSENAENPPDLIKRARNRQLSPEEIAVARVLLTLPRGKGNTILAEGLTPLTHAEYEKILADLTRHAGHRVPGLGFMDPGSRIGGIRIVPDSQTLALEERRAAAVAMCLRGISVGGQREVHPDEQAQASRRAWLACFASLAPIEAEAGRSISAHELREARRRDSLRGGAVRAVREWQDRLEESRERGAGIGAGIGALLLALNGKGLFRRAGGGALGAVAGTYVGHEAGEEPFSPWALLAMGGMATLGAVRGGPGIGRLAGALKGGVEGYVVGTLASEDPVHFAKRMGPMIATITIYSTIIARKIFEYQITRRCGGTRPENTAELFRQFREFAHKSGRLARVAPYLELAAFSFLMEHKDRAVASVAGHSIPVQVGTDLGLWGLLRAASSFLQPSIDYFLKTRPQICGGPGKKDDDSRLPLQPPAVEAKPVTAAQPPGAEPGGVAGDRTPFTRSDLANIPRRQSVGDRLAQFVADNMEGIKWGTLAVAAGAVAYVLYADDGPSLGIGVIDDPLAVYLTTSAITFLGRARAAFAR